MDIIIQNYKHKLIGGTQKLIDKPKMVKVPSLKEVKVFFLVQCNLVDNQYPQKCEVLYTFTRDKSFFLSAKC